MKIRCLIYFSLLLFFNYVLAAQDLRMNELSIKVGASHLQRQDLIFSPFIHSDLSPGNFIIDFTRDTWYYQKIKAGYARFIPMIGESYTFIIDGEITNASPHYLTFIDFDYMLGKNLSHAEKFRFTAGLMFTVKVQALNYVYGRISNFGYFAPFGIGVFGNFTWVINEKSKLTTSFQIPLVSWLARSPFMINDDVFIENIRSHSGLKTFFGFIGDGKIASWNRLQYFDFDAAYHYQLNYRWSLGAAYLFEFIHSSQTRSLTSFRNSLMISGTYKF